MENLNSLDIKNSISHCSIICINHNLIFIILCINLYMSFYFYINTINYILLVNSLLKISVRNNEIFRIQKCICIFSMRKIYKKKISLYLYKYI